MPRSATTRLGRAARAARPARRCGARTRRLDRRPSSDRRYGAHRPTSSRSSLIVTVPVSLTNANRRRSRRRAARRVGLARGPDPSPTPSRCCRPLPAPRPVVDQEPDRDDVRPSVSCCIAALPDQHSHALFQRAGIAAGPGRPLAAAGAWLNARARGSTARSTYRRGVLPLPIRRASIVTPPCPQVRVLESSLSQRRGILQMMSLLAHLSDAFATSDSRARSHTPCKPLTASSMCG
jgi:hypothetical protein